MIERSHIDEETPLVNGEYVLEKFPGKGGWTFARLPEIKPDKKKYFNWVRVRGSIDKYTFKGFNLMPMGNGQLFLSVKSEIRKKIQKQAGDIVHVILYADNLPTEIPPELLACLKEVPEVLFTFENLRETEKKAHIDYIYSAKTDETISNRIVSLIDLLSNS